MTEQYNVHQDLY